VSKSTIEFKYKIYFITFVLLLFFSVSSFFSYWMTLRISDSISRLNKTNNQLQKTLIVFADVEKIKRYIYEYGISGDAIYISSIEILFDSFEKIDLDVANVSKEYLYAYRKLLENIKKYRVDFESAKKQIPLNFLLRKELREQAQKLEDIVSAFKLSKLYKEDMFNLILFSKSILETEKASIRYFETDNVTYVMQTSQYLKKAESIIQELKESTFFKRNDLSLAIRDDLEEFRKTIQKTIEHYRTYSMLTKIVMPGNADEIRHYSKALRKITLQEREEVKKKIDYHINLNKQLNVFISLSFILLVLFSFFVIITIILQPLRKLTVMFQELSSGKDDVEIPEYNHKDEIGKLIEAAYQYKLVNKKTKELVTQMQDYQENLENKVQEEIAIRREREQALVQQSKLASMGEMIGAIAHQWRQPLNELSIRIQKLKYAYKNEKINEEFVTTFIKKNQLTINFMSKTIDDFRNFFRIDKEQKVFGVKESIEEVLSIQNAQLKNYNIEVVFEGEEFFYKGFKTEFQQVLINIISNAKDAFVSNQTALPILHIKLAEGTITIEDNAGGIEPEVLERVFEPYFTTKEQGDGTGIGLYMSKMIIEDNMNSHISIVNKGEGIQVSIILQGEREDV
jgi:C4-dicarboxylate-specific signal transduction histidine kinase